MLRARRQGVVMAISFQELRKLDGATPVGKLIASAPRRIPFTLAVVAVMLIAAVVTGALWSPLSGSAWWGRIAYGLPALETGRWWTPPTGSFFASIPVQYVPVAGGFLVLVGFAELLLRTRRTALVVTVSPSSRGCWGQRPYSGSPGGTAGRGPTGPRWSWTSASRPGRWVRPRPRRRPCEPPGGDACASASWSTASCSSSTSGCSGIWSTCSRSWSDSRSAPGWSGAGST